MGSNTYKLIDTNYTQTTGTLSPSNPNLIATDQWLIKINNLIIKAYNNYIGNNPTLVKLSVNIPYYQLVYNVGDSDYTFIVLYDFILNRLI